MGKKIYHIHTLKSERTSAFTFKGSLTVEASLVVPIFFFVMLCLVGLLEMTAIQIAVKGSVYNAARELAKEVYAVPVITSFEIEQKIVQQIGKERLERSMMVNGAEGLDCSGSIYNWKTGEINLTVQYRLQVPIFMIEVPVVSCKEFIKVKGWTGQDGGLYQGQNRELVYVAEHGSVYHKDPYCSYLNPSVRSIGASTIGDVRNDSGGKYYPCEICGEEVHTGIFYVTSYGERYHTSINCNKIQRNYYAIPIEEATGLGGCSKCVN